MVSWKDQTHHDEDFLTSISKNLAATDEEFAGIYKHTILAKHLFFQQSASTPNTSFTNINPSDTDTVLNNKNTPADNQAILPEGSIDSLLTDEYI